MGWLPWHQAPISALIVVQRHPDSVDVTLQRVKRRQINQQMLVKVATLKLKRLKLLSCIDRDSPLTKSGCSLPKRGRSRQPSRLRRPHRRYRGLRVHTGESYASMHCLCVGEKQTNGRRLSVKKQFWCCWTKFRRMPRGCCPV